MKVSVHAEPSVSSNVTFHSVQSVIHDWQTWQLDMCKCKSDRSRLLSVRPWQIEDNLPLLFLSQALMRLYGLNFWEIADPPPNATLKSFGNNQSA